MKCSPLSIAVLATVAVVFGGTPELRFSAAGPEITLGAAAMAQSASPQASPQLDEMTRFRDTKKAIEILRLQTVSDIKRLMGTVPPIKCHEPNSLAALNPEVRSVVVNFCNKSKVLVQDSKIPVSRFNQLLMQEQQSQVQNQNQTLQAAPMKKP